MYKLNNYLLLGLFSLLIFMPGIAKMPVIDRDEAHFAQASKQMLQTGNYFQIRFQDITRFQKPPGINWLQAASVKLFSHADANIIWPYRLISVFGALLSVLLTYFFARRFVGASAAKLAAALLASSLLLVVESHMAVTDTSLLSAVVLMQGALWVIYQGGIENKQVHWGWALCFWLAMTYGLVLKGVTPLVGILSIIALCVSERRVDWLRGLRIFSGLTLFISLSLVWIILVNAAEHSNYLLQMIDKDLLPKLKGGHESHGKPPLFHLISLPLTFWPASLFLWPAGVYAIRHRHERVVKFLLAWLVPTWVFFELMPTKLPQYVLPTFPAIALCCALAIREMAHAERPGKWSYWLQVLWGFLSLGLAIGLAILPYLVMHQYTLSGFSLFLVISLITMVTLYYTWNGIHQRAYGAILLMALLSYSLLFTSFLPGLKPVWLTTHITQLMDNHIDKTAISSNKPLLVAGFSEPSLVFNLNTHLVQFVHGIIAASILQSDPARFALVERSILDDWLSAHMNLVILGQVKGYNYSKGRWVELFLVKCHRQI